MVKVPPLDPEVAVLRLSASPPTAETVSASVVSGSVSLASSPEAALTLRVLFSVVTPESATAVGPSLVPVMVTVRVAVEVPPSPSEMV